MVSLFWMVPYLYNSNKDRLQMNILCKKQNNKLITVQLQEPVRKQPDSTKPKPAQTGPRQPKQRATLGSLTSPEYGRRN